MRSDVVIGQRQPHPGDRAIAVEVTKKMLIDVGEHPFLATRQYGGVAYVGLPRGILNYKQKQITLLPVGL